jgi:response regulator of citrate/malate metabolism
MRIKCLIVDDEPIARQIMERYCAVLPDLEMLAGCSNAHEAKRLLESRPADLLFLDINMPSPERVSIHENPVQATSGDFHHSL